jgi:DNA-binding NtrC family response regulator
MRATIVVVHDEPSFLDPVVASLKADGHDVEAFNDPTVAWDALTGARRVELLVTRIQFGPGKPHGVALAQSALSRVPGVKVLFVARSEFEQHTEGLGAFLPLPASVPQVAEAVLRVLSSPPSA